MNAQGTRNHQVSSDRIANIAEYKTREWQTLDTKKTLNGHYITKCFGILWLTGSLLTYSSLRLCRVPVVGRAWHTADSEACSLTLDWSEPLVSSESASCLTSPLNSIDSKLMDVRWNVQVNVSTMIVGHLNIHQCVAGKAIIHRSRKNFTKVLGLGHFRTDIPLWLGRWLLRL